MAILSATRRFHFSVRAGLAAWLIAISAPRSAAQPAGADYQIKAVFLYHFALFVEWPKNAFGDARSPLIIGVLGDDPFGSTLDEAVRGERTNGRNFVVRRFRLVEEIDTCHILFVSRAETARLGAILGVLRGRSILIVGDAENFARAGGMVQFVTEGDRIRLRINLDAVKAAGLTISSKLLHSVEIVTAEKK